MAIAIFDLDFTIIEGDSEWMWGEFLMGKGLVDARFMQDMSVYFQLYQTGTMEIHDYQRYFLSPLKTIGPDTLVEMQIEFSIRIKKLWRTDMLDRINWHRLRGDTTILISASNQILVEPIADMLNFPHRICTEAEMVDGLPTGELVGIPAYREGKVQKLAVWLRENHMPVEDSWAYSDSLNDIPLLEETEHPVAVTPDLALRKYAQLKGWRILDL